jgi:hypothetical protein
VLGAASTRSMVQIPADETGSFEENQKQLLSLLGGATEDFYGYCGVSIRSFPNAIIKSVGGIGTRDYFSSSEPIAGVAEYNVETANREPDNLAAPKRVIEAWAKEQIVRIARLPLTESQRVSAYENLARLIDDVRPIFFVPTSLGSLDLEALISTLKERRSAIFPVIRGGAGRSQLMARLPTIGKELSLQIADISFLKFAICPQYSSLDVEWVSDDMLRAKVEPNIYKTTWDMIFNMLCDQNLNLSS